MYAVHVKSSYCAVLLHVKLTNINTLLYVHHCIIVSCLKEKRWTITFIIVLYVYI